MYSVVRSGSLGALERRNPLPAGRYAIDVVGASNQKLFVSWAAEPGNKPIVRIESTTETPSSSSDMGALTRFTFLVSAPVAFPTTTFGFPDIVTGGLITPGPNDLPATPGPKPAPAAGEPDNTPLIVASAGLLVLAIFSALHYRKKKAS